MAKCPAGDCLQVLCTAEVLLARQEWAKRKSASNNGKCGDDLSDVVLLQVMLEPHYDRTAGCMNMIPYSRGMYETIRICPAAYCVLVGVRSHVLVEVLRKLKLGELLNQRGNLCHKATLGCKPDHISMAVQMIEGYVKRIIMGQDCNPAPGAARNREVNPSKQPWAVRFGAFARYCDGASLPVVGDKKLLARVWKAQECIKDRQAKSHSKCDTCKDLDMKLEKLAGSNTKAAQLERGFLKRACAEHEATHMAERAEFDRMAHLAEVDPRSTWTIAADAATAANFDVPRPGGRPSKSWRGRKTFSLKLMCVHSYGFGFFPFLIHDSQKFGANLLWTVLWVVLCEQRDKYGFWPDQIHLQLDNTTGENKNFVLLAVCSWLVATGRVKRVRVCFLPVGHTHILIDQIIGVITKFKSGKQIITPSRLEELINEAMSNNQQYLPRKAQRLHCLWDWTSWVIMNMDFDRHAIKNYAQGSDSDEQGSYHGMKDLYFCKTDRGTALAHMKYRELTSHPYRPADDELCTTISSVPDAPPDLADMKPKAKWAGEGSKSVPSTVSYACTHSGLSQGEALSAQAEWDEELKRIPGKICDLDAKLKLKFRHFTVDHGQRHQLTGPLPAAADGESDDDERQYQLWKYNVVALRTDPLRIDPVIHSGHSKAQHEIEKRQIESDLRGCEGPTCSPTTPIFCEDFVLANVDNKIGLYKVDKHGIGMGTNNTDWSGTCVEYVMGAADTDITADLMPVEGGKPDDAADSAPSVEPSPMAPVEAVASTLPSFPWGVFSASRVLSTDERSKVKTKLVKTMIRRDQIVVFNARLVNCINDEDRHHTLSLESIRAMARGAPDLFTMVSDGDIPASHLTPVDDGGAGKKSVGKKRGKGGGASGRKRLASGGGKQDDGSDKDGEEEEDDDSDDEEEEDKSHFDQLSERAFTARGAHDHKVGSIGWVDWSDDASYRHLHYAALPVQIVELKPADKVAKIRWYDEPSVNFHQSTRVGHVLFRKFWDDPTRAAAVAKSKRLGSAEKEAELKALWSVQEVKYDRLLPLSYDPPSDALTLDGLKVPTSYLKGTLIPLWASELDAQD
jgi:hypothetical protein